MRKSVRERRAARIAAAMPIVGKLTRHTAEVNGVWWARRSDRGSAIEWLALPFSKNGRGAQDLGQLVDESNYDVIGGDLDKVSAFGTDYRVDLWPGGSIHTLMVRADDALGIRAAEQWIDAIAGYPLADEAHYSDLEWKFNHPTDSECYSEDEDCCGNRESEDDE